MADRVVGQLYSITGANTVRMPINEPTVSSYWGTYTGAIDTALTKGNVILAYWAVQRRQAGQHGRLQPDVGHGRRQVRRQPERLLRGHQRAVRLQHHRPEQPVQRLAGPVPERAARPGDPRRRRPRHRTSPRSATTAGWTTPCSRCTTTRSSQPGLRGRDRVGATTSPSYDRRVRRAAPSPPSGAARWARAARTASHTTPSTTASRAARSSPTTSGASAANCAASAWAACTGRACATATGTA